MRASLAVLILKVIRTSIVIYIVTCSHHTEPTYPDLMKYLISVDNWKLIAAFLLNDKDGRKVAQIEKSCHSNIADCRSAVIQEYLESGDVSWKNVLKALRSAEYGSLADKIEKSLEVHS